MRSGNGERAPTAYPAHTSRSPESAPSTLACAVSSTELSGTFSAFARLCNAVTRSSGSRASCSPMPGSGVVVHRGTAGHPLISQLPGRVAAPPRPWRDRLALHEEGVGGEDGAVLHRHAVVHERANPDGAAGADRSGAGLVRAVLLRVALDNAQLIENTLVPDGGQGRLGDVGAVVEHSLAEPNANQPPEHALEGRAVEDVEEVDRMQLPHPLDPPETGVVDGADGWRWRAQRFEAALHQRVVDRGDGGAEREEHRHDRVGQ